MSTSHLHSSLTLIDCRGGSEEERERERGVLAVVERKPSELKRIISIQHYDKYEFKTI